MMFLSEIVGGGVDAAEVTSRMMLVIYVIRYFSATGRRGEKEHHVSPNIDQYRWMFFFKHVCCKKTFPKSKRRNGEGGSTFHRSISWKRASSINDADRDQTMIQILADDSLLDTSAGEHSGPFSQERGEN